MKEKTKKVKKTAKVELTDKQKAKAKGITVEELVRRRERARAYMAKYTAEKKKGAKKVKKVKKVVKKAKKVAKVAAKAAE